MSKFSGFYSAIDEINSYLHKDLIGPVEEDEVIENIEPLNHYAMGILWARRLRRYSDEPVPNGGSNIDDSDFKDTSSLDNNDDSISEANTYKPSTMGVSVMLPADIESLKAIFTFGKYTHSTIKKSANNPRNIELYTRKSHQIETIFNIPNSCKTVMCNEHKDNHKDIDFAICVRKIMPNGSKLVTVYISNVIEVENENKSEYSMFQCKLHLRSDMGFLPIYQNNTFSSDEEEQTGAMQYREVLNYATGHGCSVRYKNETNEKNITDIYSEFMPIEKIAQMKTGAIADTELLNLAYWQTAKRTEVYSKLQRFIDEYANWYKSQTLESKSLKGYENAVEVVLSRIEDCINRLRFGAKVLCANDNA